MLNKTRNKRIGITDVSCLKRVRLWSIKTTSWRDEQLSRGVAELGDSKFSPWGSSSARGILFMSSWSLAVIVADISSNNKQVAVRNVTTDRNSPHANLWHRFADWLNFIDLGRRDPIESPRYFLRQRETWEQPS